MNTYEFEDNRLIRKTAKRLNELNDERYVYMLADVLMHRIYEEGVAPMPMDGDKFSYYVDKRGKKWYPLFTDLKELEKGATSDNAKSVLIKDILSLGLSDDEVKGVMINPYGDNREIRKVTLEMIFEIYKKEYLKK